MATIVGPAHAQLGRATPLEGFGRSDLAIAVDDRGAAVLVGTRPNRDTVLLSERPRGGTFGAPVVLRDGARAPEHVAAAAAGRGAAILAWRESGSIVAVLRDPGGTFGAPRTLGRGQRPQVAIGPDGEAVVTWLANGRVRALHRPAGEDPTAVRTLSGTGASAARLAMARGTATIAWARRPRMEATTVVRGVFAPTRTIGRAERDGRVAVAARATTSVVGWVDRKSVSWVVRRAGRFGDARTRRLGARALLLGPPRATVTASGEAVVAWAQDGPTADRRRRTRIYAGRRLLATRPGFADLTGLVAHRGRIVPAWIEGLQRPRVPGFFVEGRLLEPRARTPMIADGEGPVLASGGGELVAAWALVVGDAGPETRWAAGR